MFEDCNYGHDDEMLFEDPEVFAEDDVTKQDPLTIFPTEIAEHILTHLSENEVRKVAQVSKAWHTVATSMVVWRELFLRDFKAKKYDIGAPYLQMGGLGLGRAERCEQDWRAMYRARWHINRNWEKSSPKAVYFSGHTDSVYCCQFDENRIITGSRDRTIRVWDLNTYKCLKVIAGPASKPSEQAPPLQTVAGLTIHEEPSVNATAEGNRIFHQPSEWHSASILCLQFDKKIMVTGSSDFTCLVWDIDTFEPIKRLERHSAGVLDVCFDSEYIVSCSKDTTICVWSRHTYELLAQLHGHRGPVNAVQLRGTKLISASGDGISKLWDLSLIGKVRTNQEICVKEFKSKDRGLAAVEFSDDGRFVLAGGNDQVIYQYDVNDKVPNSKEVRTYRGHQGLVRSLFLDATNKRVLSGSYDQGMRVYHYDDTPTPQLGEIPSLQPPREVGVYDNWTTSWILAAKCDYRRIVATSQDGRALLMDFGHGIDNVEMLDGPDKVKRTAANSKKEQGADEPSAKRMRRS